MTNDEDKEIKKFRWIRSSLQASEEVTEFPATEATSNLAVAKVQYSVKRLCSDGKG